MTIFSNEPDIVEITSTKRKKGLSKKRYHNAKDEDDQKERCNCSCNCWSCFAHCITCWAPSVILKCCGMKTREVRQAWREKVTLCFLIFMLCTFFAFMTYGLGFLLCPKYDRRPTIGIRELRANPGQNRTWMQGFVFNTNEVSEVFNVSRLEIMDRDVGGLFPPAVDFCKGVFQIKYTPECEGKGNCMNRNQLYYMIQPYKKVVYDWEQVQGKKSNLIVYDGQVWDLTALMETNSNWFADEAMGLDIIRHLGSDATPSIARRGKYGQQVAECLTNWFKVGDLSTKTMGCLSYQLLTALSLFTITLLILTKFFMAVTFSWFMSRKLDKMKKDQDNSGLQQVISQQIPDIVKQSIGITMGTSEILGVSRKTNAPAGTPFVILFVTCYSEGRDSIEKTLDSLASTDYHDQRKLLFIVADGLITGKGNTKSTPEIVLEMLHLDENMGDPRPMSYVSVEEGVKQHNMAKVFVGLYGSKGRSIPTVLIVKCGTQQEEASSKPGNRGKRDSQLILMNFLQRVIFNELMTPLEFDLFNKMYWLLGIPPDWFSYVLMVDADTRVANDSLRRMVNAMIRDPKVVGLCGETRIANKSQSWVTMIQVFEYYISHHLGKAFESVFGGVTCLPGCFSMYRVKGYKDGHWVPILVHPNIIQEYAQENVNTLHKKNLLLLGEDRYLTTLLIKTFPNRKLIFIPRAICHTIVPHQFRVLLSQRRRWINSTLHNLLELVQLNNLCGIFCFSMQFVILMELIATVILPAAIIFTIILIVGAILNPQSAMIPLILLFLVLGLPALLIVMTSFRFDYLFWMLVYLLALPVWNFILPIYAYWHFDDFTWGKTHKLASKKLPSDTGLDDEEELPEEVPMKTWIAWSRHYLRQEYTA